MAGKLGVHLSIYLSLVLLFLVYFVADEIRIGVKYLQKTRYYNMYLLTLTISQSKILQFY